MPLGVDADYQYNDSTVRLEPGDFVTLFTDGISEAMNADNQLYGLERLTEASRRPGGRCRGAGPPDSGRREAIRRRPPAKRRHVPGLLRP